MRVEAETEDMFVDVVEKSLVCALMVDGDVCSKSEEGEEFGLCVDG